MLPNQDIEPKKLAAVCCTDLLSNLGEVLLVVVMVGSSLMLVGANMDLTGLLDTGARGRSWNLEQVWVEMLRML